MIQVTNLVKEHDGRRILNGLSVELPLSEGTDPVSGAARRRALARGPSK